MNEQLGQRKSLRLLALAGKGLDRLFPAGPVCAQERDLFVQGRTEIDEGLRFALENRSLLIVKQAHQCAIFLLLHPQGLSLLIKVIADHGWEG